MGPLHCTPTLLSLINEYKRPDAITSADNVPTKLAVAGVSLASIYSSYYYLVSSIHNGE